MEKKEESLLNKNTINNFDSMIENMNSEELEEVNDELNKKIEINDDKINRLIKNRKKYNIANIAGIASIWIFLFASVPTTGILKSVFSGLSLSMSLATLGFSIFRYCYTKKAFNDHYDLQHLKEKIYDEIFCRKIFSAKEVLENFESNDNNLEENSL